MARDALSPKPVAMWRLAAVVPLYLALTLMTAALARPPLATDPFGRLHLAFLPLANALPGTGFWQAVFGLDQPPADAASANNLTVLIAMAFLVAVAAICGKVALSNKARNDKDSEIERAERIRMRLHDNTDPGRRS